MAREKRKRLVERDVEVMTCDQCHKELQEDDIAVRCRMPYRMDPCDFCSYACLAEWARTQSQVDGMLAQAIAGPQDGEP